MQISSDDPLNVACRLLDIARRLDLAVDCLTVTRIEGQRSHIHLQPADPASELARLFEARAREFLALLPEPFDG